MLGISGPDPAFRDDNGGADAGVTEALLAFAAGQRGEQAVLTALAGSRLLVPVVAVRASQTGQRAAQPGAGDDQRAAGHRRGQPRPGGPGSGGPGSGGPRPGRTGGVQAADMAMPTLIGLDGRRAIPAFTSQDAMHAWQGDARPVPVTARRVWQAAAADSCAVVIDVAGPVPVAVEGARLAALARGESAPAPCADPDVHEAVSAVLAGQLAVAAFELRPGGAEHDLVIALRLSGDVAGHDVAVLDTTGLAAGVGNAVMERLGGRLRRGIAIWLGAAGASA